MASSSGYNNSGGNTPPPPPPKKGFFGHLGSLLKWGFIGSAITFLGYEGLKTSDQIREERINGVFPGAVRYISNCTQDIVKGGAWGWKKITGDDTPIQSATLDFVYVALPENAPDNFINEARVEIENIARNINDRGNYYHNGLYAGSYPVIIISDNFNSSADTPKASIRTSHGGPQFEELDHDKYDFYKVETGRYSKNKITFVMD